MKQCKSLRQFLRHNPHAYLALYVPVFLVLFFTVEALVPADADYWVSYTRLDDYIPFVPAFIVPYCAWFPYLIATGLYLMVRDRENFLCYMYFIMAGFSAALVFCLLVPNGQNLRPEAFETENIFTRLTGLIYAADTNTNVFPSMHVIGCGAAVCAAFKSPAMRRLRASSLLLSLLICASTVLIKQHSALDILGAAVFIAPLYIFIYVLPKKRNGGEHEKA